MLQLPADLPLVTPADIEALLEVHGEAPAVTLAPSRDQRGSNAVACSPPDLLPLRFGDDSFFPICSARGRSGVEPQDRRAPGSRARRRHAGRPRAHSSPRPSDTRAYAYLVGAASRRDWRPAPAPPGVCR